ncbi:MAG: tRNA 2-thiouridine(34) synthase MnmA [Acidobacteria bacterium]|nr:MAG: tRNA 2-thiouridine(34) synthase MnmA [Acidobacteriota bacterium]
MRIAVLLSGGVDSSVALRLLQQEGHEVVAFYLKVWLEDEHAGLGDCPWQEDLEYARAVCEQAGVPLEVASMQRQYHRRVVEWTIAELAAGRTPSPDVVCNRRIKLGAFLERLERAGGGFDRVASGHYARLERRGGRWRLLKGVDPVKDQSYFLHRLDQRQLARCLFPLGGLTKRRVRQLARRMELPTRDRPDSQGICFLGRIRYDDFVRSYLDERPGPIRDVDGGRLLGRHRGPWFYTIGQRKGLGLGGGPWYVVAKDLATNVIWVVHGSRLAARRRDLFRIPEPHWIDRPPRGLERGVELAVKVRHAPAAAACRVVAAGDGGVTVRLAEPDAGLAGGQPAVLYDGEVCLGGGPIATEAMPAGRAESQKSCTGTPESSDLCYDTARGCPTMGGEGVPERIGSTGGRQPARD